MLCDTCFCRLPGAFKNRSSLMLTQACPPASSSPSVSFKRFESSLPSVSFKRFEPSLPSFLPPLRRFWIFQLALQLFHLAHRIRELRLQHLHRRLIILVAQLLQDIFQGSRVHHVASNGRTRISDVCCIPVLPSCEPELLSELIQTQNLQS